VWRTLIPPSQGGGGLRCMMMEAEHLRTMNIVQVYYAKRPLKLSAELPRVIHQTPSQGRRGNVTHGCASHNHFPLHRWLQPRPAEGATSP